MSGLLAGKVWQSALSRHLKPLAAAFADIANDDGTSIRPGLAYTAWLLADSDDDETDTRTVQRGIKELRLMGVLDAVAFEKGGRGRATEYRLVEEKLPKRRSWREIKGDKMPPFEDVKGDICVVKGDICAEKGGMDAAPTVLDPVRTVNPPQKERARSVSEQDLTELSAKFPSLNVSREWEKAKDWLRANGRAKKDELAFLRNWLRRAEDDAKSPPHRNNAGRRTGTRPAGSVTDGWAGYASGKG